ncbi:GNAT family N-acetyltransferase [Clostridium akagii]|uniref:GNAT family N-acetyltransferase n=1 Tax=Clostridium akagii TaxID=91623 RepID=UPI00047D07A9|nr:GNAT family protein [Clostridium akagii]
MEISLQKMNNNNFYFYYKLRCENKNILYTGHSKQPEYSILKEWSKNINEENKKLIYLVEYNNICVGYIHLDIKGKNVEIGYAVSEKDENKGTGTLIVRQCILLIEKEFQYIEEIIAWIAEFNEHSIKCVLNNNFIRLQETKETFYEGYDKCLTMRKYIYRTKQQEEF